MSGFIGWIKSHSAMSVSGESASGSISAKEAKKLRRKQAENKVSDIMADSAEKYEIIMRMGQELENIKLELAQAKVEAERYRAFYMESMGRRSPSPKRKPKKAMKGEPVDTMNRFGCLEVEETPEVEMVEEIEEERAAPAKKVNKNVSRKESVFTTKTREQRKNDAPKPNAMKQNKDETVKMKAAATTKPTPNNGAKAKFMVENLNSKDIAKRTSEKGIAVDFNIMKSGITEIKCRAEDKEDV